MRSKIGQRLPNLQRPCLQILEQLQKNVLQHNIGKALNTLLSTTHIIIKRFSQSAKISVCKGKGRKSALDELWALVILSWKSLLGLFLKLLYVNTVDYAICKYSLKLYHAKKPYGSMIQERCHLKLIKNRLRQSEKMDQI